MRLGRPPVPRQKFVQPGSGMIGDAGEHVGEPDGRICLSNNAAERALRGIALGRRSWLVAGSDRGGERAAAMYTLIATAKLNHIAPQASSRKRVKAGQRVSM